MIDFFTALLILGGFAVILVVVAVILYFRTTAVKKKRSEESLAHGQDNTEFGAMLQAKYRDQRESGDFKYEDFK